MSCLATRSMPPMRLQPGIMRFSSLQYGFCAPGLDKDKVAPGATAWAHPQAMQRLERPVPPLPQTLLHWCWHHLPSRQRQPSGCAYLLGCPLPLLPVPHQSANAIPQCTEVKEETGTNVVRRTFWPAACGCSGSTMRGRCWPAWLLPRSNQDWRMAGVTADARWRAGTFFDDGTPSNLHRSARTHLFDCTRPSRCVYHEKQSCYKLSPGRQRGRCHRSLLPSYGR